MPNGTVVPTGTNAMDQHGHLWNVAGGTKIDVPGGKKSPGLFTVVDIPAMNLANVIMPNSGFTIP